eukprot:12336765-Prorocentrum_lima.AAC.1
MNNNTRNNRRNTTTNSEQPKTQDNIATNKQKREMITNQHAQQMTQLEGGLKVPYKRYAGDK